MLAYVIHIVGKKSNLARLRKVSKIRDPKPEQGRRPPQGRLLFEENIA
jgi:hypothetical protein